MVWRDWEAKNCGHFFLESVLYPSVNVGKNPLTLVDRRVDHIGMEKNMAKTPSKMSDEILDQVAKARLVLDYFNGRILDDRGSFVDPTAVRSRLNAAKAHLLRAMEKAQGL